MRSSSLGPGRPIAPADQLDGVGVAPGRLGLGAHDGEQLGELLDRPAAGEEPVAAPSGPPRRSGGVPTDDDRDRAVDGAGPHDAVLERDEPPVDGRLLGVVGSAPTARAARRCTRRGGRRARRTARRGRRTPRPATRRRRRASPGRPTGGRAWPAPWPSRRRCAGAARARRWPGGCARCGRPPTSARSADRAGRTPRRPPAIFPLGSYGYSDS